MSGFLTGRTSLTSVQTADIADNAITLDKLAHQADGSILTFGTDTAPALLAPATSGNVLTTKGAGALPSFDAAGHKEFWVSPLHGTTSATDAASTRTVGTDTTDFLVKNSDISHTVHFQWQMPADFSSLTSLLVVNIADATETFQWDVESDYGLIDENYETNSESQANQTKSFVDETFETIDVSGVFSSVTALDICGVHISPDVNTLHTVGLRCVYA
tara:strand:+ start:4510 stop:5160 length:651 start_codon:yes stop_codon:yes gene_type:complete